MVLTQIAVQLILSLLRSILAAKLIVTSGPRHAPGVGPVLVETRTGGVGISSLHFSFSSGEVSYPPEVSGISPREGVIEGGQRVVLRGSNLGESKSDVVRVVIAGVDCTESVEYLSQCKWGRDVPTLASGGWC